MAVEFLNQSEKELHSKLLPEVALKGKKLIFQGHTLEFGVEPNDPEKVEKLILSLFVRGLTVKNLRELKNDVFQTSNLSSIGFGGVTVDDGMLNNTTLLSNDAIMNLFKLNPYHGTAHLENQAQNISQQIISFLNDVIKSYPADNQKLKK